MAEKPGGLSWSLSRSPVNVSPGGWQPGSAAAKLVGSAESQNLGPSHLK